MAVLSNNTVNCNWSWYEFYCMHKIYKVAILLSYIALTHAGIDKPQTRWFKVGSTLTPISDGSPPGFRVIDNPFIDNFDLGDEF